MLKRKLTTVEAVPGILRFVHNESDADDDEFNDDLDKI